ncbi:polysaccharide pyruvyl transferase family protein [Rhizobium sp. RAF56]|jgi:polysaccharide pyruvyl transferase WcaK-like protein|uniref:polysaccharide pyruvyl transferase family protein n=1 Tax=Rhizobium sp. RAF56 TaxID=3233062 RepID=UPI003F9AA5C8
MRSGSERLEPFADLPSIERSGPASDWTSSDEAPRLRLFNAKYSPNLGDGLLSECLEKTLIALGADSDTWSIDLAGRRAYGDAMAGRKQILSALDLMPGQLRQQLVRLPLAIKARQSWRPHFARHLAGANGVVIGGGNLLSDIDLNFPTKLALAVEEAERLSLPFAVYASGVAKSWTPRGLAMVRQAFSSPLLRGVFVRDRTSKQLWDEKFGVHSGREAVVVRDPGLLASDFIPRSNIHETDRPVAGIGVMSHIAISYHADHAPGRAHLENWYLDLVKGLVGRGFHVVAFTNGSPEDIVYLQSLRARMAAAGGEAISFPVQRTPDELCAIISGLEVLVAYRLHAIIAAYSFGVPSVGLAWDQKLRSFMQSVHREAFLCDVAVTSAETTIDLLCQTAKEGIPADERERVVRDARSDVQQLLQLFTQASDRQFTT